VDRFSIQEQAVVLPEGYRLWWFYSSRKAELDLAARSHQVQRAQQKLRQWQEKLRSPRCRQRDPNKVAEAIQNILDYYDVKEYIKVKVIERSQESYRQRGRGRPGPQTEYIKHVRQRLDLEYSLDSAQLTRVRRTDGVFPLVTNDKDLSALAVLQAYKGQP